MRIESMWFPIKFKRLYRLTARDKIWPKVYRKTVGKKFKYLRFDLEKLQNATDGFLFINKIMCYKK